MKYLNTTILNKTQKSQIKDLWNKEYPISIKHQTQEDFENYLSNLTDQYHILIENENSEIKAWYFDFERDEERWFAMIVGSEIQGKGYGAGLINKGKIKNSVLNGWVINSSDYIKENAEEYKSPVEFYQKMGFQIFPEVKLETKVLKTIKIKWKK